LRQVIVLKMMKDWQKRHATCEAPIVLVIWWDASQSSTETLTGPVLPVIYNAGVLDEVVGFLVEETEDWLIIADSFEADAAVEESGRRYRSVRNITRSLVCSKITLERPALHLPLSVEGKGKPASREAQAGKSKGAKVAAASVTTIKTPTSRGFVRLDKAAAVAVRKRGTVVDKIA